MITSCSEKVLDKLRHDILRTPTTASVNKQNKLIITIAYLKQFLIPHGDRLVKWTYDILLAKISSAKTGDALHDRVTKYLVGFLTRCLSFLEAIYNSSLGTLFELTKETLQQSHDNAIWILSLVADQLPEFVIPAFHRYLITQLVDIGNPITMASSTVEDNPINIITMLGREIWNTLLDKHASLVRSSVVDLLESYLLIMDSFTSDRSMNMAEMDQVGEQNIQPYILGYILTLPLISTRLTNECWPVLFKKLYHKNMIGTLLVYEKNIGYSKIRGSSGELVSVSNVFGYWLSNVAFVPDGVIMNHALDVAVMVDTVVYDQRLNLQHLVPSEGKSIMDTFLPSFSHNDISSASIDLVDDWVLPLLNPAPQYQESINQPRETHQLKIPIFFLQLAILKDGTLDTALELVIKLMSRLPIPAVNNFGPSTNSSGYLLRSMMETVEEKWPSFFSTMLEQLFSKAMALNITGNNEDTAKVENIFGNLAIISNDQQGNPMDTSLSPSLLESFSFYMASHWRQVMVLFLNHPSNNCHAMGYRVLLNSKFWQQDQQLQSDDITTICKTFTDSWFKLLKSRYSLVSDNNDDEYNGPGKMDTTLVELQHLIIQCILHETTSSTMLSMLLDAILNGNLDTFPRLDADYSSSSKMSSFLTRVAPGHSSNGTRSGQNGLGPPRYIPNIELLESDTNHKDKIYLDNIRRTANIFSESSKGAISSGSGTQLMEIINSKLPTQSEVSLDLYDEALPHNIPYSHDITNGGAFKDRPVLFLILDQHLTTDPELSMAFIRSIFIYFITFWNLHEVTSKSTCLHFATQLEETLHLLRWMKSVSKIKRHHTNIYLRMSKFLYKFLDAS
ncbi:hypothetical protein BCR42DRAFT_413953 [Absidia repens]|uniref:Uncharacterized protein n=1 Tax=Absidia repens TaxID=90262 RepID=A0A1X2IIF2_9FUNG|nr:hypothetical protein BCR42DRAFT_413953 [Absidia repens]